MVNNGSKPNEKEMNHRNQFYSRESNLDLFLKLLTMDGLNSAAQKCWPFE